MASAVSTMRFGKALTAAGIIRDSDLVTRVVIDAQVGGLVKLYVERWGDERLLSVVPTLEGIEITSVEKPADAAPQA